MWRLIVPIAFFCTGFSFDIEDISQMICKNATAGDVLPNPQDCTSYFICDKVPLISFCDVGLHFDAKYKVCNWPALAKCQVNQTNIVRNSDPQVQLKQASVAGMTKNSTDSKAELKPDDEKIFLEHPSTRPQLAFIALDVHTHSPIDPLAHYDPENVTCRHYGIYFLPHPTDCSTYYLCAFGHMLEHKCGRATGWNYKRQVCEIRPFSECFNGTTFPNSTTQILGDTATTKDLLDGQSTVLPPDNGVYTVCYILNNGIAGALTWTPQPTTDITPSVTYNDQQFTPAAASSTGRVKTEVNEVPDCPKDVDAYFPHVEDCSKYYICIIGMPVLTSCPEGLYWDQKAEVCDLSKKVYCPQQKSKINIF
ncbi:probable chitinase 10 [Rhagoletis pomonella]|uniref:probable chitinase 10 n=1 Tax=Rhagoletis pomonella TaxID=28610 RepID=UPI00177EDE7D|nr:probable chitinase 10 [Rhagoletis pomonella]